MFQFWTQWYIDGLVQDFNISTANALESFRVASMEAVSYDLSRGLPTGIFDYVRFIFVQYVHIVL